eukprot:6337979-Prymnesium_polylepis.1
MEAVAVGTERTVKTSKRGASHRDGICCREYPRAHWANGKSKRWGTRASEGIGLDGKPCEEA